MGVVEEENQSVEVLPDVYEASPSEEKESSGESLTQNFAMQSASFSPMSYPSTNWGFSYQVDKSRMSETSFYPWRGDFLNLFLPLYNDFVDHSARRINEIQADASLALSENDYQSTQISTISGRSNTNKNNITALTGSLSYVTGLIDHLGNTVVPNVSTIAKNAQSVADYAKSSVDHIGGTVVPNLVAKDTYQAGQISTISNRSNSNKNELAVTKGVADYAKSSVDHIGGTVVPNLVEKDDYQAGQISTVSNRSLANVALIDHIGGTVISKLVEKDDYQASQIVTVSARSSENKNNIVTVKDTADYAKSTVDHIGGTVIPSLVAKDTYQAGQISTVSERSTSNGDLLDHIGGTVVPSLVAKDTYQAGQISTVSERSTSNSDLIEYIGGTVVPSITSTNSIQQTQINTLMASELLTTGTISDFKTENAENLTFINSTLKGLKNYDDTSFKNLLNERFSTFFSVNSTGYESGSVIYDGIFTKLIKGQFTRLIAELNRHLTLSFTTTTDNIESFQNFLREEFGLLNDWASLQVDWSKMINDNILIAIESLNNILAKPNGDVIVEVPPSNINIPVFDYDRLKQMLDDLSFGNVINEAGTNLWDVLQQLIDSLGGVVESIVQIVPNLIEELIALIIPENKNFFSEGIDDLISSFDSKFEWTTSLSNSFKTVYSSPKSIKSLTIPIGDKNYNVVPDSVDLNLIKTILTGYFSFLTLFTSYKRIVGGGDVIQ